MKRCIAAALVMLTAVSFFDRTHAADYPTKPINLIVPFSPGGGTDIAARTLVPFIEKYLPKGSKIVILNRPGAGGEIGFTELALAKPDGYTIGFVNMPALQTKIFDRKVRYKTDSFAPIANIISDPGSLSVETSRGFKTLGDLVAAAKAKPGEITVGVTAMGSDDHLGLLQLEALSGAKFTYVPTGGTAETRRATMGRHVTAGSMNLGEAVRYPDKLRVLGQMTEARSEIGAQVPTFKELGFAVISGSKRGIAAPKGTPPEIIQALARAIRSATEDPAFIEKAGLQDLPLDYMDTEAFTRLFHEQAKRVGDLWASNPWIAP